MLAHSIRASIALALLASQVGAQTSAPVSLDSARRALAAGDAAKAAEMLIVSDGKLTSSVDALSSLDWHGSLPWPDPSLPTDRHPTFTLKSANETISSNRETWKQSWRLTLNVPVIMR